MKIPKTITAGDSVSWLDTPWLDTTKSAWVTSALWDLVYELRGQTQLTPLTTAQGDGWASSITSVASASLQPGTYVWAAYLKNTAGDRRNIGGGTLSVIANLSAVTTSIDGRSQARQALDDCEAALAKFTSGGKIKSYTIGGRQTEFHSLSDLMTVRDFWQRKVNKEEEWQAIRDGRSNPRKLLVRF